MRLEHMTPAHVRRAIQIYMECAWPEGSGQVPAMSLDGIEELSTLEALFGRFERIAGFSGGLERFALRLGNAR